MKDSYDKSIQLVCITCADSNFEYNDEKTWIKCNRCKREYNGGYDELVELNQENIANQLEESKQEIKKDLQEDLNKMFKDSFKNIKLK